MSQTDANKNAIRPFRVDVPEAELTDLRRRIKATRLPEKEPVADISQGVPLATIEKPLNQAESKGLLERDWARLRPTARGQRFLNELLELFLAAGKEGPAPDAPGGARVIRISSRAS